MLRELLRQEKYKMNVHLWDKIKKKWLCLYDIKYIILIDSDKFKIDDVIYYTDEYRLKVINNGELKNEISIKISECL